ncbi:MAG: hypothetical protein ABH859_08255 [Pseudomonadota bacterium]
MMNSNKPQCFSGSPILSSRGRHCSAKLQNEIIRVIKSQGNTVNNKQLLNQLLVSFEKARKWIVELNYKEFWIDGGHSGVMLHPFTHVPIWLNAVAIEYCRFFNGQHTVERILNEIQGVDTFDEEKVKVFFEFILLLEDLDMVTIKRNRYE